MGYPGAIQRGRAVAFTGGTGGLGEAIAWGLARHGAAVAVAGRDEGKAELKTIGGLSERQPLHLAAPEARRRHASFDGRFGFRSRVAGGAVRVLNGRAPATETAAESFAAPALSRRGDL